MPLSGTTTVVRAGENAIALWLISTPVTFGKHPSGRLGSTLPARSSVVIFTYNGFAAQPPLTSLPSSSARNSNVL